MLAAVAALVLLVGAVLPWYTAGNPANGITPIVGNAFEGSGIVVFLGALAVLALVTLPYAAGDRPVGVDRWPAYGFVLGAAVLAYGLRVVDLVGKGVIGLPDRAAGLWITAVGLVILSRAVFEIWQEPEHR
jgi:hypothetical protein